jgi:hypothetical protein
MQFVDRFAMASRGARGGADEEAPVPPKPSQQRFRPVEPHDGPVVQMESIESGASAGTSTAPRSSFAFLSFIHSFIICRCMRGYLYLLRVVIRSMIFKGV